MAGGALPKVRVYSDGGARGNPGPAAIGVVVCDGFDSPLTEHRETIGRATNNEAEYRALIRGLELAARYTRRSVECFVDSELVANQVRGDWKVKEKRLEKLVAEVRRRTGRFQTATFRQVPRSHRMLRKADDLVNQALDERYGGG